MHDELEYGIAPPAYRLPAGARPGAVMLQVADLGRSVDFYQAVLGLRVLQDGAHSARLGPQEDGEVLVELRELPGATPAPPQGRLGLYHFAVLLPDRPALGRFLRHAAERGVRVGAADHRVSEALYLSDPDGLGIEVYADRPRAEWRHRDRELVMTTDPLDAADVVRSAGDQPWRGAPSGTVMGHVHLHVGDLERASAFYHQALGLDRVVWSYPGALFLSAGGYHHHLGLNTWARGAPPAGEGEARLLEWRMVLPAAEDVSAALASLAGHGFAAASADDAGLVRDPWGTAFRLTPAPA